MDRLLVCNCFISIVLKPLCRTIAGYLQELVYKLSKVGQAIEKNDLSAASSVLGPNTNSEWVQNVNRAFTKVSEYQKLHVLVYIFVHPYTVLEI